MPVTRTPAPPETQHPVARPKIVQSRLNKAVNFLHEMHQAEQHEGPAGIYSLSHERREYEPVAPKIKVKK